MPTILRRPPATRSLAPNAMPCAKVASSLMALLGIASSTVLAGHPVILTNQHVDLRIIDRPGESNRLGLVIRDADSATTHATTNVVLELPLSARMPIPEGFEVFGPVDSPFWILPQSQDPAVLYLGISAEGLPAGTFDPRFQMDLVRVEGPGNFFLWQFDTLGNLVMSMNSRDGISAADSVRPLAGGHEHFNWGFNASGVHDVVFRVSNRLRGTTNVVDSGEVTVRFGVQPYSLELPAIAAVLSAPERTPTVFRCRLSGTPGRSYPVEASTDLKNWEPSGSVTTGPDGSAIIQLPSTSEQRFVRARTP